MMGSANRAPKSHYGRKFEISAHAVERFRERVEEEFIHRPNQDLMNLLDERICNAKRTEDVIDHFYRDTPSKIYVIESRKGVCSLAVVRENTCVTVLDEDMLEANVAKGSWSRRPINTPFAGALAGVKVAPTISKRVSPPKLTTEPVEIAVDPIAAAGIAHAHALLAEHTAAARIFELELAIERAKAEYQTAKETRLKADRALTDAVTARTIPTAPKET